MNLDVFLSSNSRDGYSQDVIDLFAKPSGARHQFRYASKWVSPEVIARISQGMYREDVQAVLCYIDQTTKRVTPLVLPVRFAKILEVREHGTTISIVFKLDDFCTFDDLDGVNTALRKELPGLPGYDGKGNLSGQYWLSGDTAAFGSIKRSNNLKDWELLIENYYKTPNAIEDIPFYRFEGVTDIKTNKTIEPMDENGILQFTLDGGEKFDVSIYHFHPKKDFPDQALQVSADNGNLVPMNGDTRVLNTRYDRKDYRFETKQIIMGAVSSLSFRRTEMDSGKLIWEDFLLGIKIRPSWKLGIGYVSLIAVGFAIPFIVRSSSDPKNDTPMIWAALIGGIIIGVATLFKEKIRL